MKEFWNSMDFKLLINNKSMFLFKNLGAVKYVKLILIVIEVILYWWEKSSDVIVLNFVKICIYVYFIGVDAENSWIEHEADHIYPKIGWFGLGKDENVSK